MIPGIHTHTHTHTHTQTHKGTLRYMYTDRQTWIHVHRQTDRHRYMDIYMYTDSPPPHTHKDCMHAHTCMHMCTHNMLSQVQLSAVTPSLQFFYAIASTKSSSIIVLCLAESVVSYLPNLRGFPSLCTQHLLELQQHSCLQNQGYQYHICTCMSVHARVYLHGLMCTCMYNMFKLKQNSQSMYG